jgi:hypothetical protein
VNSTLQQQAMGVRPNPPKLASSKLFVPVHAEFGAKRTRMFRPARKKRDDKIISIVEASNLSRRFPTSSGKSDQRRKHW